MKFLVTWSLICIILGNGLYCICTLPLGKNRRRVSFVIRHSSETHCIISFKNHTHCTFSNFVRDGPFELLGGGAGLFLVRPLFFLLPENQDIFFDRLKDRIFVFGQSENRFFLITI